MKKTGMILTLSLFMGLLTTGPFLFAAARTDANAADLSSAETGLEASLTANDPLWADHFNGTGGSNLATAIAVGDGRNIYVTGKSQGLNLGTGPFDILTIKYEEGGPTLPGVPAWEARYDGPAHGADLPLAIAVDGEGNVLVMGYSLGDAGYDIVVIKYNGGIKDAGGGTEMWEQRHKGPANDQDLGGGMALDSEGNVYVTGRISVNGVDKIVTIKYRGDTGGLVWDQTYEGRAGSKNVGNCIAVDSEQNVYVGGMVLGTYATFKYNRGGALDWVKRRVGRDRNSNQVRAIGVDANGGIHVTGDLDGRFQTMKYNKRGRLLFQKVFQGRTRNPEGAQFLALDPAGDVYVTGETDSDIVTIKYAGRTGAERWRSRFNTGVISSTPTGIAMDGANNVYVVGSGSTSSDASDIVTFKLDTQNGRELWSQRFNSATDSQDVGTGIALDTANNVCVTGYSCAAGNLCDYTTIKYVQ